MTDEDDFIARLIGFGLTEKEAQCYFHLLKYGSKAPSSLAKSLNTYREDVHRTLNSLIEKGMVRPSLGSPTIYTAVTIEIALESALRKHESEMREMEMKKRELQEIAQQQRFSPSDEVGAFKILKTVKEIISTATPILQSTEQEFLWIAPKSALLSASIFGINDVVQELTKRGGTTRGITDITYDTIRLVQEVLDVGEKVHHFDGYRGMFYTVFDRKHCISAININIEHHKPDEPATMLYTDDPVYARYLVSTFELMWQQSIPAEERIQELLGQAPS